MALTGKTGQTGHTIGPKRTATAAKFPPDQCPGGAVHLLWQLMCKWSMEGQGPGAVIVVLRGSKSAIHCGASTLLGPEWPFLPYHSAGRESRGAWGLTNISFLVCIFISTKYLDNMASDYRYLWLIGFLQVFGDLKKFPGTAATENCQRCQKNSNLGGRLT